MKDYSAMSDFEINCAVAIALWDTDFTAVDLEFEPCSSWCDAGPIIHSNRIMLNPYCADELWKAEHEVMDDGFIKTFAVNYDKNPLRAAMIVFLMMQESK